MKLKTRRKLRKAKTKKKLRMGIIRHGLPLNDFDKMFFEIGTKIGKSVKRINRVYCFRIEELQEAL